MRCHGGMVWHFSLLLTTFVLVVVVGRVGGYAFTSRRPWYSTRASRQQQGRQDLSCSLHDLRNVQRSTGRGSVEDVSYEGQLCKDVYLSGFERELPAGLKAEAVEYALQSRTLLIDRSHWGVLSVRGEDRLRFLHSQGTNSFEGARPGRKL
ncbi:unnamed protein product [Discosporangium mesarthrocarpum]